MTTGLTIRPLECGWITTDFQVIAPGNEGRIRVPVPAYVIEHPSGVVVFDLGMHASLTTSHERIGRLAGVLEVDMPPESRLAARLEAIGQDPERVALAVVSHLHFDHAGGLAELPNATLVVQEDEWEAANDPGLEPGAYVRDDFDLGHPRRLIDGTFDLFGDGRLVLHQTLGHTAGHQSLLVDGRTLLVGDACNCRLALDTDALPTVSHDHRRHRETFAWLRKMEADGVALVFSHDPEQWAELEAGRPPWDS